MSNNKRINDTYSNKARAWNIVARSFYKLEEIDNKFNLFDSECRLVADIWCAPWSWLQYASKKFEDNRIKDWKIIWFDLKTVTLTLPHVTTYAQDITDKSAVESIFANHKIDSLDLIISDMAPDTIWMKDIDALRSVNLIEKTLRIYDRFLKEHGKFAIKIFMWPWFDDLVRDLKGIYWASSIIVFKPKACRKSSKETYIVKKK